MNNDRTYALAGDAIIRMEDLVAVTPTYSITKPKRKNYILHYEGGRQILIGHQQQKKLRKLLIKHADLLAKSK